ncbi:hypothetical protein O4J56_01630 [Nocardiopsis sp. RSe5-2]|uniref:MFS transporter n=1 Tax=Nocardiopsis endophytica TaxID=3018445 RepID=A0ABT4TXA3_9ACTN|nr:hypothetical protein [Nocardiopsis endophytica]MDA2809326.1 hypothetical protein [Nocardiopsis endophytica]
MELESPGTSIGPSRAALWSAAVIGLLWPGVTLLSSVAFLAPFDKAYAWDTDETLALFLLGLLLAAVPVLPIVFLLRLLRVPHPWKTAVTGLLLACPTASFVIGVVVGRVDEVLAVLLAMAAGAVLFSLIVRAAWSPLRLRRALVAGAAAMVVTFVASASLYVSGSWKDAREEFDKAADSVVLLDDDGWTRVEAAAYGGDVQITYHSTGPESRALQVTGYSDPDAMDFDDPCANWDDDVTCEDEGIGVVRDTGSGPELITEHEGVPVTIAAPTWEPEARVSELLDAAEHLRLPAGEEREAIGDACVRERVFSDIPGGPRTPHAGAA